MGKVPSGGLSRMIGIIEDGCLITLNKSQWRLSYCGLVIVEYLLESLKYRVV